MQFLSAVLSYQDKRLVRGDGDTYRIVPADGVEARPFTLDRDTATASDDLDLLGLDHPLMLAELGRWRSVPPEELGISVTEGVDDLVTLSIWLVESSASAGERKASLHAIAVNPAGTRVPHVERQAERYFSLESVPPRIGLDERVRVMGGLIEPSLQRELKAKGLVAADGGYSSKLVGYVEIYPRGRG